MPLTAEEKIEQLQKTIDEMKSGWDGHGKRLKQLEDERDAAIAAKKEADEKAAAAGKEKPAEAKKWPW